MFQQNLIIFVLVPVWCNELAERIAATCAKAHNATTTTPTNKQITAVFNRLFVCKRLVISKHLKYLVML